MAKKPKQKRFWKFLIGMLIYALVFLGAAAFGLDKFWDYIEAYELSRPETAMNTYMQQVDIDYLCNGGSGPILAAVDHNIQSEQACRDYIKATLTGQLRYAIKMSECTENKMVYMVMCGDKSVCKVTLIPGPADQYGFTPWKVVEQVFDLSYIQPSAVSITVPHNYPVYIGDALLDASYITETNIHYKEIDAYYAAYSPPYLVTYQSGAFLGELEFRVTDPAGNPVSIDEATDMTVFLNNCTAEELAEINPLTEAYVQGYVDFLSCANNNPEQNYHRLSKLLVPDCDLAHRFRDAVRGMTWISDRHSEISSLVVNRQVNLGHDRYLCDVTYEVDTRLHNGTSHEITNAHLIIALTDSGMKVENMTIY